MSLQLIDISQSILAALLGSGLTVVAFAKFGQSWFFKRIDAKFAINLAERNSILMSDLEKKKNELNRELQIEVTHFKAQLEVVGTQQSRLLEMKINSILLLNKTHYLAVKSLKQLTDIAENWVSEANGYFRLQLDDGEQGKLSSYDVYREMKEDRWPSYHQPAQAAFEKYAECLALNMPILPKELVLAEMVLIDECRSILEDTYTSFSRAMNFTRYIVVPAECEGTEEEFMGNISDETEKCVSYKAHMDLMSEKLYEKSLKSSALIDTLLKH